MDEASGNGSPAPQANLSAVSDHLQRNEGIREKRETCVSPAVVFASTIDIGKMLVELAVPLAVLIEDETTKKTCFTFRAGSLEQFWGDGEMGILTTGAFARISTKCVQSQLCLAQDDSRCSLGTGSRSIW